MDQIYIPKNRAELEIGSYVIISPFDSSLAKEKEKFKPYFYNLNKIEPIKLLLIKQIAEIIERNIKSDNIFFVGSLLDEGFNFKDVDVVIITDKKQRVKKVEECIESKLRIRTHILLFSRREWKDALETDPLWQAMISKSIAKKRFVYNIQSRINFKFLDLHLLKSKFLVENFETLNGNEKYKLTRNLISINLFLQKKKVTNELINKEIIGQFNLDNIDKIKDNMLNKPDFINRYSEIYSRAFHQILRGIKDESKQK